MLVQAFVQSSSRLHLGRAAKLSRNVRRRRTGSGVTINLSLTQEGVNTCAHVIGVARQSVVDDDGWIFDGSQTVTSTDLPFAGTFVHSSQGM